ncbi:macro domain-containing protein [Stackebrandtia endophytica]|uniref:macro domain-containing protein n=1 Tax=Stackebrandtia endophytica TaxID=1496996 RepID=UPI00362AD792
MNVVGVMGKGLALQFKRAFPTNFSVYRDACQRGELQAGVILAVRVDDRWIVNLPTKRHWRQPSRLSDVAAGLDGLVEFVLSNPVESVAIPPLGAGNGGLPWPRVRRPHSRETGAARPVDQVVSTGRLRPVSRRTARPTQATLHSGLACNHNEAGRSTVTVG